MVDATQWMGLGFGWGLTFLELYTWLMLRNGWVWGSGGVGDVNVPSIYTWLILRNGWVPGWR